MNNEIREAARIKNVKLWELAQEMGMTDGTLCRKMRKEFSEADRQRALMLIDLIAARKEKQA